MNLLAIPSASLPEALQELMAGNARFAAGRRCRTLMWDEDTMLRRRLAKGPQTPIAAILGCCDSRVAGNLLFDQELGRLFSVQVAGGVVGPQTLASIEFAVDCLGAPLVLVLGHTQCGAIQAAVEAGGSPLTRSLSTLQDEFSELLARHPKRQDEAAPSYIARLARINSGRQASRLLEQSEIVRGACEVGRCRVVAAVYHLETGRVRFASTTPWYLPVSPQNNYCD